MHDASSQPVEEQARIALSRSPIFDLRNLHVESSGSGLVLRGRVASFYHKQQAQELVRAVAGDIDVINELDVLGNAPGS